MSPASDHDHSEDEVEAKLAATTSDDIIQKEQMSPDNRVDEDAPVDQNNCLLSHKDEPDGFIVKVSGVSFGR